MTDPSTHVYRVTIRGRFADLDDRTRSLLAAEQANHDIFQSGFTPEGTLTYDLRTRFFNLRYEVRGPGGTAGEAAAAETGLARATGFLATMKFGHGALRANVFDASAVWDDHRSESPA